MTQSVIRPATDQDGEGLIAVIGACYADYPWCVLDVDGEMPELRGIATAFDGLGGRFWVAVQHGRLIGCVGCRPSAREHAPAGVAGLELVKLYVDPGARRLGLAAHLCGLVEDEARARSCTSLVLWSDTRFADAHRLYRRLGYRRTDDRRALRDASATVEYCFVKSLAE